MQNGRVSTSTTPRSFLDRKGTVCGKYRKTHLCGSEKRCYGVEAGDELPVFDLDFGRVGVATCMDMYFPEVFRGLSLMGAEFILWPVQTYGRSEETIFITARARAIDYCCLPGGGELCQPGLFWPYERGHELTGRAMIINPDGMVIADHGPLPRYSVCADQSGCARGIAAWQGHCRCKAGGNRI